jgi:hypothetical protein
MKMLIRSVMLALLLAAITAASAFAANNVEFDLPTA